MNLGLYLNILLGHLLIGDLLTMSNGSDDGIRSRASKYGSYVGCFDASCLDDRHSTNFKDQGASQLSNYTLELSKYTLDNCTRVCYEMGYPWAGIFNKTECTCSCLNMLNCSSASRQEEQYCGLPCLGNPLKFCGGKYYTSIYKINLEANPSADCDGTAQSEWKLIWIITGGALLAVIIIMPISMKVCRGFNFAGKRRIVRRETPRPYSDYIFAFRHRSSDRSLGGNPERNPAAAAAIPTSSLQSSFVDSRPPVPTPRSTSSRQLAAPFYHKIDEGLTTDMNTTSTLHHYSIE